MMEVETQPWVCGRGTGVLTVTGADPALPVEDSVRCILGDPQCAGDNEETSDNQWDLDTRLISSVRQLMDMYSLVNGQDTNTKSPVMSGGLQQFLNRRARARTASHNTQITQPRKDAGSDHTTFHDLPDSLQLHIFSFLTAWDLCRTAQVCKHWLMLSSDELLWQRRLQADVQGWDVIGHMSNPHMYQECQSDWSWKDIYLRCSPQVNNILRGQNVAIHQLSSLLRSLWARRAPRVAMFGPGLESSTSGLVRKILQDQEAPFKATGMFPGQFEGVGSGFNMKIHNTAFNLMTLYTTTKSERENQGQEDRLKCNRLLALQEVAAEAGEPVQQQYELRPAVKDLCRTLDAFIFVVNASEGNTSVSTAHQELFAMVDEMWAAPHIPVLVLSCVPHQGASRVSCIDVVRKLKLNQLSRPWQVHNCCVEDLDGVPAAFHWVIEQSSRR